jgi:hypothetical protein
MPLSGSDILIVVSIAVFVLYHRRMHNALVAPILSSRPETAYNLLNNHHVWSEDPNFFSNKK